MLLLKIQRYIPCKMRYVHRGTACWEFLHRNPGRTYWQVGKPLLDIIDVDSSSKVEKGKAH